MMVIAVMVVVVMAALFESMLFPMAIISSIVFSFFGMFWFFMLTGTTFSIMASIGMLVLMGVVVNNGIVMVEHINALRRSGMARTDALAVEGMEKTLARITSYAAAGADMIFAEAFPDSATYADVKRAAGGKPVLANMTEFGKVDLKTPAELAQESGGNIDIVLNPLSVYRGQRETAAKMYKEIQSQGTQRNLANTGQLQTRESFQSLIDYEGQVEARAKLLGTDTAQKKNG